jgi:hypothetical protein
MSSIGPLPIAWLVATAPCSLYYVKVALSVKVCSRDWPAMFTLKKK